MSSIYDDVHREAMHDYYNDVPPGRKPVGFLSAQSAAEAERVIEDYESKSPRNRDKDDL